MRIQTFGKFSDKIVLPYEKDQLLHLQQHNDWTLLSTDAMIDSHYPQHSLLSFFKNHPVIFPRIVKPRPLVGARTVFTDGSQKGNAVVVSQV